MGRQRRIITPGIYDAHSITEMFRLLFQAVEGNLVAAQEQKPGWANNAKVVEIGMDLVYDDRVGNTHDCPMTDPDAYTNFFGRHKLDGKPFITGYPGWKGNLAISFTSNPPSFASSVFNLTGIFTGTGGYRGTSRLLKHVSNPEPGKRDLYTCEWSARLFAADIPHLYQMVKEGKMNDLLRGDQFDKTGWAIDYSMVNPRINGGQAILRGLNRTDSSKEPSHYFD